MAKQDGENNPSNPANPPNPPKEGNAGNTVNQNSIVAKIVKDPSNPPDTLLLQGYLGELSEDGNTRLYLDPQAQRLRRDSQ